MVNILILDLDHNKYNVLKTVRMEKTSTQEPGRSYSPAVSYISSSSEEDGPHFKGKSCTIVPPVDPAVITDIEEQAHHASKSIGKLMAYISKELKHGATATSSIVKVYDGTIDHIHEEVEKNIKAMYGLIAKCEELDRQMKPINELANQVENIKSMLDAFEAICK